MQDESTQKEPTVSFRLGTQTLERLDRFCATSDITRSQLLRRLIGSFEPLKNHSEATSEEEKPYEYPKWLFGSRQ
jgi:hypothetical protein